MRSSSLSESVFDAFGIELPAWTFWAATGVVGLLLLSIATKPRSEVRHGG